MTVREFLEWLSLAPGVSGFEGPVAARIEGAWAGLAGEVRRDRLGNVIALKRGDRPGSPKLMLAAHMDEIGLMVTRVEPDGFLRFAGVPEVDLRTLPGKEVVVHGRRDLRGVVGHPPPHILSPEDTKKLPKLEDLFIDVGLAAVRARELVAVGDPITFRAEVRELKGGLVAGKGFDDRAGVAVLHQCLEELAGLHHAVDVYAVATVQEEVGLRGAVVGTYGIQPDLAIAVDVHLGDTPGVPEHKSFTLDKGPVITMGANIHPVLHRDLVAVARDLNIPFQLEAAPAGTGTDAVAMQVSRSGIPTALVSIPCRYMHSPVETVALADVARAGRLLAHFAARRTPGYLEELAWS
ncbi:MAG: M42 family metallopeptidase [bacterium]|nr:M42 family metallopeptidase [bacterium]